MGGWNQHGHCNNHRGSYGSRLRVSRWTKKEPVNSGSSCSGRGGLGDNQRRSVRITRYVVIQRINAILLSFVAAAEEIERPEPDVVVFSYSP